MVDVLHDWGGVPVKHRPENQPQYGEECDRPDGVISEIVVLNRGSRAAAATAIGDDRVDART